MKLFASNCLTIIVAMLYSLPGYAFESYTSPYQISLEGNDGVLSFEYSVNGSALDGASSGTISCGGSMCLVGFMARTGLGQSPTHPRLCDSGGECQVGWVSPDRYVRVANFSSWNDAYIAYINKFGRSSSVRLTPSAHWHPDSPQYPGVKWGSLCVGFAALPYRKPAVSQLAPGAACGVITPPDTSCIFAIQNTIDFGVVNTGDTPNPVTVIGGYSCGAVTSVSAAIGISPFLGGAPLRLYMNGVLLSNTATRVARDKTGTLTLRAEVASPLVTEGSHQASVPVLMAFY